MTRKIFRRKNRVAVLKKKKKEKLITIALKGAVFGQRAQHRDGGVPVYVCVRRDSLCGLGHLDDGQRVRGPERFGRNGLPGGTAFEGGRGGTVVMMMMMATIAVAAARGAVMHRVVVGHLHGHDVLRERPDHLLELVDLVAQVPDAGVPLVQPVLQPRDVLVLLPRLGRAARQLALQVPQPVHHGRAHSVFGTRQRARARTATTV